MEWRPRLQFSEDSPCLRWLVDRYSRSGPGMTRTRRGFNRSSPSRAEGQETIELRLNSPARLQDITLLDTHIFTCYRNLSTGCSCRWNSFWFRPARMFHDRTAPSGTGSPRCRSFTITLRHNTIGRTSLDELAVRRRELYQQSTYKIQVPDGIRTHNPSQRTAAGWRPTPRGYWDWSIALTDSLKSKYIFSILTIMLGYIKKICRY